MQKYLTVIVTFLLIALNSYSTERSITDTLVPVEIRALQNSLRVKDSFELMKKEMIVAQKIMDSTQASLKNCEQQNVKLDSLDRINTKLFLNYEKEGRVKDQQINVLTVYSNELKAVIKKKNWTIVKVGGVSIAVVAGLTYILIKK